MKISVAINTWNERTTIDLCLKALKGFADEVMVVDNGSMDGTPKLARGWIDKLNLCGEVQNIKEKNCYNIRMTALNACSGDWILMLDSTTILTNDLKTELLNHARNAGKTFCDVKSLNLIGDYKHYFRNRPFMAYHRIFLPKGFNYVPSIGRPTFRGSARIATNWAVNLSRVRPAWRCWYRGEPFDRRYYTRGNKKWANEANRQFKWINSSEYYDLIEYVETEEGKTFQDVKRIAPDWYLNQLRLEATPLEKHMVEKLPEVLLEELKNPRYKLIKEGEEIVGRHPEL